MRESVWRKRLLSLGGEAAEGCSPRWLQEKRLAELRRQVEAEVGPLQPLFGASP